MTKKALVIGGGPAGLMAAEQLVNAGLSVTIAEAKPTLGRKFLMAGKSGLNLTMDEPVSAFLPHYYDARTHLDPMITSFGPQEVKEWTEKFGSTNLCRHIRTRLSQGDEGIPPITRMDCTVAGCRCSPKDELETDRLNRK